MTRIEEIEAGAETYCSKCRKPQCEHSPYAEIADLRAQLRQAQEKLKPYALGPLGEPFFETKADAERALEQVERERDKAIERGEAVEARGADALNQAAKSLRGWVARSWRWRDRFEAAGTLAEEMDDLCDRLMAFNPNSWISLQAQAIVSAFYPPAEALAQRGGDDA